MATGLCSNPASDITSTVVKFQKSHPLQVIDLGLVDYLDAYSLQKDILKEIKNNNHCDVIIFCQHNPVITLGRQAKDENILIDKETCRANKIAMHKVDRGGDVTLHNPGQLVVYPVLDLHRFKMDLGWFLDTLENLFIDLLGDLAISAESIPGLRGVWINNYKVASIGIGVKHWITFHGAALNISNDLEQFRFIRPCGLDVEMTSLQNITHTKPSIYKIQNMILQKFIDNFNFMEDRYGRNSAT